MDFHNMLLPLSLLLLFLQFRVSTATDTITINQTFQDGDILISKGNNFALGFFSPGKSSYRYVGIWYHKVPKRTVVWVANRDNPFSGSCGVLSVNQYGNLVLYSDRDRKVTVWSTNVSAETTGVSATAAQLLDSGNLIVSIQNGRERIVWQSFDYPTDTVLQGMKFGVNRTSGQEWFLTSWRSPDDPGKGDYSTKIIGDGSPQFFLVKGEKPYWRESWPWRTRPDLFNYSFVHNQDGTFIENYNLDHGDSFIVRIMLDDSGSLKKLTWHESVGQWKVYWSAPTGLCEIYGHCGAYGMCNRNNLETFECDCLPGYMPDLLRDWNLRDGSGGCVRKRQESSSICGNGEGFVKVVSAKIPDTSAASWVSMNMLRLECERECLRTCSCTAYASMEVEGIGTGCLAWYGELMDVMDHMNDGYDIYVRVDATELAERARESSQFFELTGIIAILALCVALAWSVLILICCLWLKRRQRGRGKVENYGNKNLLGPVAGSNFHREDFVANDLKESGLPTELTFFKLSTISAATNSFCPDNKLGQGGFGVVYKGRLPGGHEIAVKRLAKSSGQGVGEFTNEVMLIAKLQHRNLVKLLGCCTEGGEQILIYEYLPNQSLDFFIFDETRRSLLDWRKRLHIIAGIARGILYLHHDSRLRIIHRDLKTSNILLDAELNPKISDFGMARIFKEDQIQYKTKRVVGTYGYMSPEYAVFGKFSAKSDVFSFGVILLEIITGKKSNCFCQDGSFISLIGRVWELWQEGKALAIMDSTLEESYVSHEVLRCIQIGLLCVQEDADDRPTMLAVVLMLDSEISLPNPKQPAYIFRKTPENHEGPFSINELTFSGDLTR